MSSDRSRRQPAAVVRASGRRPLAPKPAFATGPRAAGLDREGLGSRLAAGLAELGLPEALADRLLDYLALLVKWNAVYNLTAVRDPQQMLTQHLLDSLSIVAPLAARLPTRDGAPAGRVVDVGSGAGLPGIVLALAWPHADILLVEPVGKKAAFLRQCQSELTLANLQVAGVRVEELGDGQRLPTPDLVVCRAFASLADYVASIERLAGPSTVVAAMKGAMPADEIAALPPAWELSTALPLQVPGMDAARHLLLLRRRCAAGAAGPEPIAGEPAGNSPEGSAQ